MTREVQTVQILYLNAYRTVVPVGDFKAVYQLGNKDRPAHRWAVLYSSFFGCHVRPCCSSLASYSSGCFPQTAFRGFG